MRSLLTSYPGLEWRLYYLPYYFQMQDWVILKMVSKREETETCKHDAVV